MSGDDEGVCGEHEHRYQNDLTDRGATPLERDTLLVSKHWNVANSIITGQFIRRASLPLELALMAAELLYHSLGLGNLLQPGRDLNDTARLVAVMLVIVALGVAIDRLMFAPAERRIRERWGLLPAGGAS